MSTTKKIGIAFFLAAVGFLAFFFLNKNESFTGNRTINQTGMRMDAPAGQLAAGFPKDLALEQSAKIDSSYSIPYEKFTQYTSSFVTSKSLSTVYNDYLKYLKSNGYQILNSDAKSSPAHIYAIKTGSDINVVISTSKASTTVSVTYLSK